MNPSIFTNFTVRQKSFYAKTYIPQGMVHDPFTGNVVSDQRSPGRTGGKTPDKSKKDECSYSFSNAIKTLVMVAETGLGPAASGLREAI